ncbi:kelch repeat-containing protein isoform X2 [Gymnodraco acuticeps]|uniref:Kelch repeat-containing protein isoform X2 n=1 Tax=Gymnodraco acuticeps TaxID=8218 RepID=A0A6P8VXY2_GYMAC|nr:kelch repeat-containing protein isoform X2 [Gymnodraco acuticeps]
MEDFGIYAVFGVNGPPQRLLSPEGSCRVCVAVPPNVHLVVLFSSGPWGQRVCVNAELNDADRFPITIGKLTPYNKCLSWEQWEEETWTDSVTLDVTLEGGNLVKADWSKPEIMSVKEYTPKDIVAPLAAREIKGKKRERESEEDCDENKTTTTGELENICPNGGVEKTTPLRKARGQSKRAQKLFSSGADATKIKGTAPLVSPSGRWGQTLCPIDAQTAILIGGQGARMQFCKDPMWKLCTEDMSWVAAETLAEGPTPEARIGHTAVYDPDSRRIFVFGGSKNKKWFNDVHILDTRSWKWTMVEAQGKVPPLAYHSCSMFRGELFVLGGVFPCPNPEPDGCSDSLYIFDPNLSIWYQPIVTGNKPSPRSGHSACVMQQMKIYVFGGWDTPVCYNDMYMLDLGLMEFSAVKTSGKAPSPRSWHGSAVLSDTKFLIHGGYNGNNALTDAFVFDIDTNSWTEATLPQLSLPRAGHSIVTMETDALFKEDGDVDMDAGSIGRNLLVFGGGDNERNFYSDLTTVAVEDLLAAV